MRFRSIDAITFAFLIIRENPGETMKELILSLACLPIPPRAQRETPNQPGDLARNHSFGDLHNK